MRATLRRDLTAALKSRDRVAVAALRSALAAIENAEAIPADHPVPGTAGSGHIAGSTTGLGAAEADRRQLTEDDLLAIVEAEVHERSVSAAEYEQLGRDDHAQRLRAEADLLRQYLPRNR